MRRFMMMVLALVLVFGMIGTAYAIKIGTWTFNFEFNAAPPLTSPQFWDIDVLDGGATIFDALTTPIITGNEYLSNASTDSGFTPFTSILTNGTNEAMQLSIFDNDSGADKDGVIKFAQESIAFGTSPDFAGEIINQYGLIFNTFSYRLGSEGGVDKNIWTVAGELNVYDGNPVPEPTTILLLGAGLVGLAGFGRKKFKK